MAETKRDTNRYLQELESKVEVLKYENDLLAERGEDTLLLGIVSEQLNADQNIDEIILAGLEKISLLKNIPFCAYCKPVGPDIVVRQYYFLCGNDRLMNHELVFPREVRRKIAENNLVLLSGKQAEKISSLLFETMEFKPTSWLVLPSGSVLREPMIFCFAAHENGGTLSRLVPLLERVVEMMANRIETLTLLGNLQELTQKLDQKVHEKTRELALANEGLMKSEKKFRDLFQQALDMIHFVSRNGTIIDANPAELRTLGYSREQYIGMPLTEVTDPAYREGTRQTLTSIFSGREVKNHQSAMIARDGRRIDVEVNAAPVVDGDGTTYFMAIIRNVSERKKIEEQQLTIKKLESIGVLAGGIAHDFNNILAVILGNVNIALQMIEPQDQVYALLREAEKGSLQAKDLTQQLLTLAKGEEPVRQVASIVKVIRDAADFVLRGTNIRCNYAIAEDLWPVAFDRVQIRQVIQNLVLNARHAMPMGGEIDIRCRSMAIETPDSLNLLPGRYIRLAIRDHGVGIPPDHLERIFDPYFTTKEEGSGLGLAITHSIIAKHSGHIEVNSKPGSGTEFIIFLPAADCQEVPEMPDQQEKTHLGNGKIIIMDDDKMVREITGNMLTMAGFAPLYASNGEEAIKLVQQEADTPAPVQAVILDLTIPGAMGGLEAAEIINRLRPETKLISASGYTHDPAITSCREYGFAASLVKPFSFKELVGTVHKVLSG